MHRIAVAVAALAALAAVSAGADENVDRRIVYAIEGIEPAVPGLTATIAPPVIAHLPPVIEVRNTTVADLVVLDADGVAMLRAGPSGTYGNDASRWLATSLDPRGGSPSPAPANTAPPAARWRRLGRGDRLRWWEQRAAYTGHGPPDQAQPAQLASFRIETVHGGRPVRIDGVVRWKPARGSVQPVLTAVEPKPDGVFVRVIAGPVPAIELRNESGATIEIAGRDGRPFARVGPEGVESNVNSATYRDTRTQPEATDPSVQWRHQQDAPVLVWLERRAAYEGEPPEAVQAAGRPAELARWEIPGTIDGAPFRIAGALRWVPAGRPKPVPVGGSRAPWGVVGAAAGVAALGVAAAFARRRPPAG